jgi:hypothetical protein
VQIFCNFVGRLFEDRNPALGPPDRLLVYTAAFCEFLNREGLSQIFARACYLSRPKFVGDWRHWRFFLLAVAAGLLIDADRRHHIADLRTWPPFNQASAPA